MSWGKKIATAALVTSGIVASLGASTPASAGTVHPMNDDYQCKIQTCVNWSGNTGGYYAVVRGSAYYGHVDMWGPGISFHRSPDGQDPSTNGNGLGHDYVCGHGWKHENGNYIDMGFPCSMVF